MSAFDDIEIDIIIEIKTAIPINVVTDVNGLFFLSSESWAFADTMGYKRKAISTLKKIYITMLF